MSGPVVTSPLQPELTRPTGEWIICAEIDCPISAVIDILHQPDSGELIYVPLCQYHLEHSHGLEYQLETHGFFRRD